MVIELQKFMKVAVKEAKKSKEDIPVGAVIVKDGIIIAKACNMREKCNDVTSHAEIIALSQASEHLKNWRLDNCDIYVTLEPCPMCGWAILQSRINNIYFGAYDTKYGAFSAVHLDKVSDFNPKIYGGIAEDECTKLLQDFFKQIRS